MSDLAAKAFPPGVVNILTGGNELGAMMVQHPNIAHVRTRRYSTGIHAEGDNDAAEDKRCCKCCTPPDAANTNKMCETHLFYFWVFVFVFVGLGWCFPFSGHLRGCSARPPTPNWGVPSVSFSGRTLLLNLR